MKKQSPLAVFFLSLITLGIYSIVWHARTRGEMNRLGQNVPTTWLIIVPLVNIWWLWKWSQGVGAVTNEKVSGVLAFILVWLLGAIGQAIIQDAFNKIEPAGASPSPFAAAAPSASPMAGSPVDMAAPAPSQDQTPPTTPTPPAGPLVQ